MLSFRLAASPVARTVLILGLSFGITATANAGILSVVGGLFDRTPVEAQLASVNSQNMDLLQPALNHNPTPFRGGPDMTIIDHSALLADAGPLGTMADIEENTPSSDQISVYTVRTGDSLGTIAEMFKVSENTIRWANDLKKGAKIVPGQELVILPITGIQHTVKSGDTLESVAKKYNSVAEEIGQFNGIEGNDKLAVGVTIIVPDGEITTAVVPKKSSGGKSIKKGGVAVGNWLRPLTGGRRTQGIHGNNGIDLASFEGADIYAAASGQVILARSSGYNGGYGKYVVIKHANGTQTLYAHLQDVQVAAGQSVGRGEVIGHLGNTGRSTGPHLHFEVRGGSNPF